MSQLGLNRKRSSRSVNDFDSSDALRGALQSMEWSSTTSHSGSLSSAKNATWDVSSFAAKPPRQLKVDAAIIDTVAEIGLYGASTTLKKVCGDTDSALKVDMENELRRLAVLKSYRLVGSGHHPAYERLVSFASRVFKVPIAFVSVIDLENQHYLASRGLGPMDTAGSRHGSICASTISSDSDLLVIPDLTKHEVFYKHENVVEAPHLRFYASAPLVCPENFRLGTICILDTKPRPEGLSLDMKQNLREIADMIMETMVEERERKNFEYRQPSQMIACTSNDLMTPLSGVIDGLSSIRNDEALFNSLTDQQREVFNTAFACSSVMNRICRKSLESFLHKKKEDKVLIQGGAMTDIGADGVSRLKISELVKHLHVVMDPFPKRVPIVITIDDNLPPVILADDLKVFRSIVNYLTNACAYTDSGSVHLKIFVKDGDGDIDDGSTDAYEEKQQHVVFLVEDTGPGVDVDQYQNLFKPIIGDEDDSSCELASFGNDGGKAAKALTKKTGLGLYSVATQISSIGGQYGFRPRGFSDTGTQLFDSEGQELKGSVFWFSVPLKVSSEATAGISTVGTVAVVEMEEADESVQKEDGENGCSWNAADEAAITSTNNASSSSEAPDGRKRKHEGLSALSGRMNRALIIEDSVAARRSLSRMLNKLGFDVTEAVNGMEGLKTLQANLFDLVLCDFLMPVMDGTDCVLQYRQFEVSQRPWFDQYIVGISAHATEADVERGMKVGMNDFRPKPITMNHLEEILCCPDYQFASSRLDTFAGNLLQEEAKREQAAASSDESSTSLPSEQTRRVCLIVEGDKCVSKVAEVVAWGIGWKSIVVHSGEAALRLLKMRNWDAVLLDDSLPGLSSCGVVEHFREWEKMNRVNRQRNVFAMSSSFIPCQFEMSSTTVQLPSGFDGAIGKPVSAKVLTQFLSKSVETTSTMSRDIVSR